MIAWLLVLAQQAGAATQPTARWVVERDCAQVGEPFDATLTVLHAPGDVVELAPAPLEHDTSWIELAPAQRAPAADAAQSRWTFTLASLEPGERPLPELFLSVRTSSGSKSAVQFEQVPMTFGAALAPGEDEPRPARGFRPVEPDRAASRWPWIAGALALLAAGLGWMVWMRRRATRAADPLPSVEQRLHALGQRDLDARESVRQLFYDLTVLLRTELDQRSGAQRAALTDDEWLRAAELDPGRARELAAVFALARDVKYGAAHPTSFAVRDALDATQRALERAPASARSAA